MLSSENSLEVVKGDSISFNLGGNEYMFILLDNTETQVSMEGPQSFSLSIGADKNLDLDGNGESDIYIWLRAINLINEKVKLTLRPLI